MRLFALLLLHGAAHNVEVRVSEVVVQGIPGRVGGHLLQFLDLVGGQHPFSHVALRPVVQVSIVAADHQHALEGHLHGVREGKELVARAPLVRGLTPEVSPGELYNVERAQEPFCKVVQLGRLSHAHRALGHRHLGDAGVEALGHLLQPHLLHRVQEGQDFRVYV